MSKRLERFKNAYRFSPSKGKVNGEYSLTTETLQVWETSPNSLLATILYSPSSSASASITSILASPDVDEYVTFLFLLDLSLVASLMNHVTVIGFGPVTFSMNSIFWNWLIVCETQTSIIPLHTKKICDVLVSDVQLLYETITLVSCVIFGAKNRT